MVRQTRSFRSWFDAILEDPVGTTAAGTPLLTYAQVNIFASLFLMYLVTRRNVPREIALIIVGTWAAYQSRFFHRRRRSVREIRGGQRYYGPGW
tara:strand:- start:6717 stop:6998 length:282 start_codon:yes stop_codon:yes gene_type:complete